MVEKTFMNRITINPRVMGGKPVITGTRLTVQYILKALADGVTSAELMKE